MPDCAAARPPQLPPMSMIPVAENYANRRRSDSTTSLINMTPGAGPSTQKNSAPPRPQFHPQGGPLSLPPVEAARWAKPPAGETSAAPDPRRAIVPVLSLFQSKDEPEGSEGSAKRVLSFRVLNSTQLSSWFRGGGNVGIAPHDLHFSIHSSSDFQGLWEGRKTKYYRFPGFP
jgi:hypothetical protein